MRQSQPFLETITSPSGTRRLPCAEQYQTTLAWSAKQRNWRAAPNPGREQASSAGAGPTSPKLRTAGRPRRAQTGDLAFIWQQYYGVRARKSTACGLGQLQLIPAGARVGSSAGREKRRRHYRGGTRHIPSHTPAEGMQQCCRWRCNSMPRAAMAEEGGYLLGQPVCREQRSLRSQPPTRGPAAADASLITRPDPGRSLVLGPAVGCARDASTGY
jgi:hypothetical protein